MSKGNASGPAPAIVSTPSDREIRIERVFHAPRARVWRAMTDPKLLAQWWGRGNPLDIERYEFHKGGHWRFVEHADGEAHGFVKVLTEPGRDRILGVTIVGYHAAELLPEFVLAMKHGLGLNKILATIHVYPTLGESNRFLASEWRKARKPQRVLSWLERYHRWLRA